MTNLRSSRQWFLLLAVICGLLCVATPAAAALARSHDGVPAGSCEDMCGVDEVLPKESVDDLAAAASRADSEQLEQVLALRTCSCLETCRREGICCVDYEVECGYEELRIHGVELMADAGSDRSFYADGVQASAVLRRRIRSVENSSTGVDDGSMIDNGTSTPPTTSENDNSTDIGTGDQNTSQTPSPSAETPTAAETSEMTLQPTATSESTSTTNDSDVGMTTSTNEVITTDYDSLNGTSMGNHSMSTPGGANDTTTPVENTTSPQTSGMSNSTPTPSSTVSSSSANTPVAATGSVSTPRIPSPTARMTSSGRTIPSSPPTPKTMPTNSSGATSRIGPTATTNSTTAFGAVSTTSSSPQSDPTDTSTGTSSCCCCSTSDPTTMLPLEVTAPSLRELQDQLNVSLSFLFVNSSFAHINTSKWMNNFRVQLGIIWRNCLYHGAGERALAERMGSTVELIPRTPLLHTEQAIEMAFYIRFNGTPIANQQLSTMLNWVQPVRNRIEDMLGVQIDTVLTGVTPVLKEQLLGQTEPTATKSLPTAWSQTSRMAAINTDILQFEVPLVLSVFAAGMVVFLVLVVRRWHMKRQHELYPELSKRRRQKHTDHDVNPYAESGVTFPNEGAIGLSSLIHDNPYPGPVSDMPGRGSYQQQSPAESNSPILIASGANGGSPPRNSVPHVLNSADVDSLPPVVAVPEPLRRVGQHVQTTINTTPL